MAKWKNFKRFGYRNSAKYFGKKYVTKKNTFGIGLPFLIGAAAGYLAPRVHPMQDAVITVAAVAPVKLPTGVSPAAKGYVIGTMLKTVLPSVMGSVSNGSTFGTQ